MNSEPDFIRAVIVTLIAGIVIVGTGAFILFLVFRSMGNDRPGESRYLRLALVLFAFIFICCAAFFALSLR